MIPRTGRKSFSSFLNEAPEDILAVRDREGRQRRMRPIARPPRVSRAAATATPAAAPQKPEYEQEVEGDAADLVPLRSKRPSGVNPRADWEAELDDREQSDRDNISLQARKRLASNPELESIFKNNSFIRDKYFANDDFAEKFADNEEFREYFRDLNGGNTPTINRVINHRADPEIQKLKDRIAEVKKTGKFNRNYSQFSTFDLGALIGFGNDRRPSVATDDYLVKRFRDNLKRRNSDRQFSDDGSAIMFDDEKRYAYDTGRQFDLNDEDVFDNYYKSVARALQSGADPVELLNTELERKIGEEDLKPDGTPTNAANTESKFNKYIHQIPEKYDLSNPDVVKMLNEFSAYGNIFEDTPGSSAEPRNKNLVLQSKELLDQFDFDNNSHMEFLKGMAGEFYAPKQGETLNRLLNLMKDKDNEEEIDEEDYETSEWSNENLQKFFKNHMNEENAYGMGHLLGGSENMHMYKSIQNFLNSNDVNHIPSSDDLQDEDSNYFLEDDLPIDSSEPRYDAYESFLKSIADKKHKYNFEGELGLDSLINRRLNESLFSYQVPSAVEEYGLADIITGDDDRMKGIRQALHKVANGEDDHMENRRIENEFGEDFQGSGNMVDVFDNLLDHLTDSYLDNNGSNSYETDQGEETDELLSNYDVDEIFNPENRSIRDMPDIWDRNISDGIDEFIRYSEEQREEQREEEEDDDESGNVNDYNHPRQLWGAETPEEAPRRTSDKRNPIQRARDAALGRVERGSAQVADKARAGVERMPRERRDKVMGDPRVQGAYGAMQNLNLRGTQAPPGNPDAEGDDRWEGSKGQRFNDDFTSFGLDFFANPNNYKTHKIDSLDDDLEKAGLSRGDLRRAVYIAWSARQNNPKMLEKFKERFGADADDTHPEYQSFAKKATALNAKTNWKNNVLPALQKGDILYNTPVGGADGERALLYSMMGFGKDGYQGQQAVVGADGKVYPLDPPSEGEKERQRAARQRAVRVRRGQNESYIYEEQHGEFDFFQQMFPDLEVDEVMEIMELIDDFRDAPERKSDAMDSARQRAFANLNKNKGE